jgi:membrane protein implicated in regulation of membrane protease activity
MTYIWWVLAFVLVGVELLAGTVYLLAYGLAFAAGGLASWLGVSLPLQFVTAGVVALLGTFIAHRWRRRHTTPAAAPLDIGHAVRVQRWKEDGTARVDYRGSQWDAELAAPGTERTETMYIVGMRGSTLLIADRRA